MVNNITEASLKKSVMQWLKLHSVLHERTNVAAVKTKNGGFIKTGVNGSSDIKALHKGVAYAIECKGYDKNGRLGKQSEAQKEFEQCWIAAGGVYILLTPDNFKDLEVILNKD